MSTRPCKRFLGVDTRAKPHASVGALPRGDRATPRDARLIGHCYIRRSPRIGKLQSGHGMKSRTYPKKLESMGLPGSLDRGAGL